MKSFTIVSSLVQMPEGGTVMAFVQKPVDKFNIDNLCRLCISLHFIAFYEYLHICLPCDGVLKALTEMRLGREVQRRSALSLRGHDPEGHA